MIVDFFAGRAVDHVPTRSRKSRFLVAVLIGIQAVAMGLAWSHPEIALLLIATSAAIATFRYAPPAARERSLLSSPLAATPAEPMVAQHVDLAAESPTSRSAMNLALADGAVPASRRRPTSWHLRFDRMVICGASVFVIITWLVTLLRESAMWTALIQAATATAVAASLVGITVTSTRTHRYSATVDPGTEVNYERS